MPYDRETGRAATLERGDGVAELAFGARASGFGLLHLYQHDPCRVLFPRAELGHPPTAVLLTTSGGLTGGDRIRASVSVGDGAAATVTTQAAEKIYRSLGPDCRIDLKLEVGPGWLEYIPQETILFDRARLTRHTQVSVTAGGRFLGCEMVMFGRRARGERFATGLLHDAWRVYHDGRLMWADALRLEGDVGTLLARAATFDEAAAVATVLYVADDAARHLQAARALLAGSEGRAGATVVNGILVARLIGRDTAAVRGGLVNYLCGLRAAAAGWPPTLPRVWYT